MGAGEEGGEMRRSCEKQGTAEKNLRLIGQRARKKHCTGLSIRACSFKIIICLYQTGSLSSARNFVRLNLMMLGICSIFTNVQQLTLSFHINRKPDDGSSVPHFICVVHEQYAPVYITCLHWQECWESKPSL